MASVAAALIALLGVIIAGFLSTIVAEDYRRFRDGSGLAAALAGELGSYMMALDMMLTIVDELQRVAETKGSVHLGPVHGQVDHVFETQAGKLGLLGPVLAEDTAFVYHNIRAFRSAYRLLSDPPRSWDKAQVVSILRGMRDCVQRAKDRGVPLVVALKTRAAATYPAPWRR